MLGLKDVKKEEIETERKEVIKNASSRVYKQLVENPEIFEQYFIRSNERGINREKLPLLIGETEVRILSSVEKGTVDLFALFGIYVMLFLYESDKEKIGEHKRVINELRQADTKLYDAFINDSF